MNNNSSYTPFESITKRVFYPCERLVIKVKIGLGSRDQSRHRRSFVNEYQYDAKNKYIDVNRLSSMFSETKDYLIIEEVETYKDGQPQMSNNRDSMQQMYFSYDNLHQLSWCLNSAYQWISNPDQLCDKDKTGMISNIKREHMNLVATCISPHWVGYSCGVMKFTPTIRSNPDGMRELAILVTMGKEMKQITSLNLQEIAAWAYFMEHFDLCSTSIELANQVLITAPILRKMK